MTSGGAPLKPWEVARGGTTPTAPTKSEDGVHGELRTHQPFSSYASYSGLNTNYASPYQAPRPYGGSYYGYPSPYGGGVYGATSYGGGMYGYGRPGAWNPQPPHPGMMGNPMGSPPPMPMWQRFLEGLQKVVHCFGRVSFLVDENTQAFHFFITALLAFLDKAGSLYGEILRFILKLLGFGRRRRKQLGVAQGAPNVQESLRDVPQKP